MSYIYNTVQPEALKDSYGEYDTADFNLTFENQSIVLETITVEGIVPITGDPNGKAKMDSRTGIHGIVESIRVDSQNGGIKEHLTEYVRHVHMESGANYGRDDYYNSQFISELRCDNEVNGAKYLKVNNDVVPDFAFKPRICLNKPIGTNKLLGYSKEGSITISIRFRRNQQFLYGEELPSTAGYDIRDLKLCYITVPEDNKNPVMMKTYVQLKQVVDTQLANINTRVPAICDSVSCSFYPVENLNKRTLNQSETVAIEGLNEVIFMFNDSTNKYITYPIRTLEEIKDHYKRSLSFTTHNALQDDKDKTFGIGLNFEQMIDLRNQKFNVQIKSNISRAYQMYMYFHSVISM